MSNSPDVAIKALATYLRAQITGLTVLEEWPDPKIAFTFPTLSIIAAGVRGYRHEQPTIHAKLPVTGLPDLFDVVYTVGQFDYQLQLDIWCEYKSKRGEMFDLVHAALDKQFIDGDDPCGLSLTLSDYYNLIARFDQVGYTYPDSEESSQRSEWRVKIDVLVNHSRLLVKRESKMLDIEIHHQISDTVEPDDLVDNVLIKEIEQI